LIDPEGLSHGGDIQSERVRTVGELGTFTKQPVVFCVRKWFGGPDADPVDEALPFRIPGRATAGAVNDGNFSEVGRSPDENGCS